MADPNKMINSSTPKNADTNANPKMSTLCQPRREVLPMLQTVLMTIASTSGLRT